MLISILLRPFTMLSNALRYQERLHFIVNFIEFPVKFFDPLDSFHCQPDELFVGDKVPMCNRGSRDRKSRTHCGFGFEAYAQRG